MKLKKLLCVVTLVISLFALTICASAANSSPENPNSGNGGHTGNGSPQTSDVVEFNAAWVAVPVVFIGAAGVFTALALKKDEKKA